MRSTLADKLSAMKYAGNTLIGQRGTRIIRTGGWALIAKICSAVSVFICIPFALNGLGEKHFGAWMTIISIFTFSSFLDFGIGNGAMNLIADAKGRNNLAEASKIANQSLNITNKFILALAIAFTVLAFLLPWHKILGLTPSDSAASSISLAIVFVALLLSVQVNLVARLQLGLGEGYKAYKLIAAGQIATIPAVIMAAEHSQSLPVFVAASTIIPLLFLIKNTFEFRKYHATHITEYFRPGSISSRILKSGIAFFALQLIAVISFNFDLLLISANLGATAAGDFSIVQRIFSVIPILMGLVWNALWPAYSESLAKGDYLWAINAFKISTSILILFSLITGSILAFFINDLIILWLDKQPNNYHLLAWSFVIWNITVSIGSSIAVILNSANILKFQIITFGIFALVASITKVYVMNNFGIEYINTSSAFLYLFICVVPALIYLPNIVSKIENNQKDVLIK
jgi:O-antigen/teichoic acid export membrane protein